MREISPWEHYGTARAHVASPKYGRITDIGQLRGVSDVPPLDVVPVSFCVADLSRLKISDEEGEETGGR